VATRRRVSQRSLTGSISDIQRRVKYLQNRQTPTRLGNQAVQRSAIQYRAVGTDQIAPNSIVNDQIQANAIAQAQLSDDSVGRDEIINGEVVEAKLGTDAVTRTKIKDGEVITGKLGSAAVELVNMSPNSVANTQLTTDSVNFRTVDTNAIGNENMLDNSVGNSELQNDSVGNGELRNDSVGFSEMQSSSVGTSTLQTGAVTRSKIGSGQVGTTQIENRAVTRDKIAFGAVGADALATGSVLSSKLAANSVTSTNISGTTMDIIVSRGLRAGFGISKSGNSISINTLSLSTRFASSSHRHSFFDRYGVVGQTTAFTYTSSPLTVSSSIKRKKDVQDYELENPKNLLNLKFKKFKYKRSDSNYHTQANREWMHGYIIEELMDLGFDEVIHYDKDGNPEKLDYSLFSALVLELVKVQQQEIDCLQEKVKKLEKNDIPI
jgi:hypothetical protein